MRERYVSMQANFPWQIEGNRVDVAEYLDDDRCVSHTHKYVTHESLKRLLSVLEKMGCLKRDASGWHLWWWVEQPKKDEARSKQKRAARTSAALARAEARREAFG